MKKRGILAGALLLAAVCLLAGLVYWKTRPETKEGEKQVSLVVVHGDKTEKTFVYDTDARYLGEVLLADGLLEGEEGPYGFFITSVDQEAADESKQQWWCITKEGEQVNTAVDKTPVYDGDTFELTLKEGY